jgi:hypothetical protein
VDSANRSLYNRSLDILYLDKEEIVRIIIYLRINAENRQIISEDELSTYLFHSDRLLCLLIATFGRPFITFAN